MSLVGCYVKFSKELIEELMPYIRTYKLIKRELEHAEREWTDSLAIFDTIERRFKRSKILE